MKISVIVPIYNSGRYLVKCVESVLAQSYSDFELLLINDGSIDNSDDICCNFVEIDSRIVYYKRENSGVSNTRNFGLERATGDWIFFLDSDDTINASAFDQFVSLYVSNNNVDAIYFPNCLRILPARSTEFRILSDEIILSREDSINRLLKYWSPVVWGKFFRSDFIKRTQFREDIKVGEDLIFQLENVISKENVSILCSPLIIYNYLIREGSAMYYSSDVDFMRLIDISKCIFSDELDGHSVSFKYFYLFNLYHLATRSTNSGILNGKIESLSLQDVIFKPHFFGVKLWLFGLISLMNKKVGFGFAKFIVKFSRRGV